MLFIFLYICKRDLKKQSQPTYSPASSSTADDYTVVIEEVSSLVTLMGENARNRSFPALFSVNA